MNEARIKVHQASFQVYQLRCEVRNDIVRDNLEVVNEVTRKQLQFVGLTRAESLYGSMSDPREKDVVA